MSPFRFETAPITAALLLSACNSGGSLAPAANPVTDAALDLSQPGFALRPMVSGKIKHVIIIVQENRSFNNLFYNFPGAKTVSFGYDSNNKKDKEHVTLCGGPGQVRCPKSDRQYAYVPQKETQPSFDMGKQYVLADEMYASSRGRPIRRSTVLR